MGNAPSLQNPNSNAIRPTTETTESTTSTGSPASCMTVIGFAPGAMRNRRQIAADIGVFEHEIVARVIAHRFDAHDQLEILHARRAILELAQAVIDKRNQIGETIGNRRVDGEAGIL